MLTSPTCRNRGEDHVINNVVKVLLMQTTGGSILGFEALRMQLNRIEVVLNMHVINQLIVLTVMLCWSVFSALIELTKQ